MQRGGSFSVYNIIPLRHPATLSPRERPSNPYIHGVPYRCRMRHKDSDTFCTMQHASQRTLISICPYCGLTGGYPMPVREQFACICMTEVQTKPRGRRSESEGTGNPRRGLPPPPPDQVEGSAVEKRLLGRQSRPFNAGVQCGLAYPELRGRSLAGSQQPQSRRGPTGQGLALSGLRWRVRVAAASHRTRARPALAASPARTRRTPRGCGEREVGPAAPLSLV